MNQKLILASTSPYRRELLSRLGLPFETANPRTDETPFSHETPEALALRLSEAKARAVIEQYPGSLIIGSDQVAILDDQIFGKPGNHERAVEQLQRLSGRGVNFFTGLCLLNSKTGQVQLQGVPTQVTFRHLTANEIECYLQREQPYQCAGAAKVENLGIALLERCQSDDPTALIGLPLIALCAMLRREGIDIL